MWLIKDSIHPTNDTFFSVRNCIPRVILLDLRAQIHSVLQEEMSQIQM